MMETGAYINVQLRLGEDTLVASPSDHQGSEAALDVLCCPLRSGGGQIFTV